jgi:hypothetical protein
MEVMAMIRLLSAFGLSLGVLCGAANGLATREPAVVAHCDPCRVEPGKSVIVFAEARDLDGDSVTYRWTAPAGAFADRHQRQTIWTAPDVESAVAVMVAVSDGRGGFASDTIRIRVVPPLSVFLPNRDPLALK